MLSVVSGPTLTRAWSIWRKAIQQHAFRRWTFFDWPRASEYLNPLVWRNLVLSRDFSSQNVCGIDNFLHFTLSLFFTVVAKFSYWWHSSDLFSDDQNDFLIQRNHSLRGQNYDLPDGPVVLGLDSPGGFSTQLRLQGDCISATVWNLTPSLPQPVTFPGWNYAVKSAYTRLQKVYFLVL